MAIEEPSYEVIKKSENFEIRQYQNQLIAEVTVEGSMSEASSKGFKLVADFIFGNNQKQAKQSEKIAMTAPVIIEAQSEKIAMTAPVVVEQKKLQAQSDTRQWVFYFIMPSIYTMDTLPKPNNSQIQIKEVQAKKVAVIRFSGLVDDEKLALRTDELNTWIKNQNFTANGAPQLARYNPPWILPWWRRNEVMIPVQ
jgi:phosphatidate phosphatase PAH1